MVEFSVDFSLELSTRIHRFIGIFVSIGSPRASIIDFIDVLYAGLPVVERYLYNRNVVEMIG